MPPGVVSLSTLRTAAQQRCDMVNSSFISTAEWNSYINASIQELYDLLVRAYGPGNWYGKTATFTTDGTNYAFNLTTSGVFAGSPIATDYFVGYGVDLQIIPGQPQSWVTLHSFTIQERNRWSFPTYQTAFGLTSLHYCYVGDQLWLRPTPQSGLVVQLIYAPRFTALVNDADTFDGINGWEEHVILGTAAKAALKEESYEMAQMLMSMQSKTEERVRALAGVRDAGSPAHVADVRSSNASGGYNGGGDGGGSWY